MRAVYDVHAGARAGFDGGGEEGLREVEAEEGDQYDDPGTDAEELDRAESGSFHLALAVTRQVIALSVTDGGGTGTAPKAEHQDGEAEHGRGLGTVTALAHRVVIHDSNGGYTVTAELFTGTRPGDHLC